MVAIARFAGTNCEFDMQYVYEKILGVPCEIVWHKQTHLPSGTRLVVLAGGFSYGDYLRSGAIARFAPIMSAIKDFAKNGGRVLGICNGFQILTEANLLPGALKRNKDLHFISKNQNLIITNTNNAFLRDYKKGEVITLPIAHADGSYYCTAQELEKLKKNEQILLKYESDINGSVGQIAGICNEDKNVFGLMPHPERACEKLLGSQSGLAMLKSILDFR